MVAEEMREKDGIKAGVVAPRCFRPFPFDNVRDALKDVKAIACMDRSSPGGALGALFNEVSAALYAGDTKPVITNYIYGLGGRDLTVDAIKDIYKELNANAKAGKRSGKIQQFVGLRGPKLEYFE
jgi:pyruvate ferredoxin oxidoreductase alpha subunit